MPVIANPLQFPLIIYSIYGIMMTGLVCMVIRTNKPFLKICCFNLCEETKLFSPGKFVVHKYDHWKCKKFKYSSSKIWLHIRDKTDIRDLDKENSYMVFFVKFHKIITQCLVISFFKIITTDFQCSWLNSSHILLFQ